jgi:WD40 repeat protein
VEGHLRDVFCVTFDQTGQRVVTGADDGLIKIWCARTCLVLGVLRGHKGDITELTLSSSAAGTILASSSNDGNVRLWDVDAPRFPCIALLNISEPVTPVNPTVAPVAGTKFRPARPACPLQLLTVSASGTLALWTEAASQLAATAGAGGAADLAGGAADGVAGAAGGADIPLPAASADGRRWLPAATRTPVKHADEYIVFEGVWSPGGTRFAVGTTDEVVHVYRVPPPTASADALAAEAPFALSVLDAAAPSLPAAQSAPQLVATLRGHRHDVTSLCWSSRGDALLSGSKDSTARVWRLKGRAGTGRVLGSTPSPSLVTYPGERWSCTLLGDTPWSFDNPEPSGLPVIGSVAWCADDSLIVTARSDGRMLVWCGQTGAALRELTRGSAEPAHSREVYVLNRHPLLPHVVVSASYDGSAVVWDVRSGLPLHVITPPKFDQSTVLLDGQWGPGGDILALTDSGGRLSVWGGSLSAATPAELHRQLESGETQALGATCLAASDVAPLEQFYRMDLDSAPVLAGAAQPTQPLPNPNDRTLVDGAGQAYPAHIQQAAANAARAEPPPPVSTTLALQAAEDRYMHEQRLLDELEARVAAKPTAKRQQGAARPPPALACERGPVARMAEVEELTSEEEDRDADYGAPTAAAGESDGDTEGDTDGDTEGGSDEAGGGSGRGMSQDDWALTAGGGGRVTRSSRRRPQQTEGRTLRRRATQGETSSAPGEASTSAAGEEGAPIPAEPRRRLVRASDGGGASALLAGIGAPAGPSRRASTVAAEQRMQQLHASGILGDDSDSEPKPKRRRKGAAGSSKGEQAKARAGQRKPRRRAASSSEEEEEEESGWDSEAGSEPGQSEAEESEGGGRRPAGRASRAAGKRPAPRRAARRVVSDGDEGSGGEAAVGESSLVAEGGAPLAAVGRAPLAGEGGAALTGEGEAAAVGGASGEGGAAAERGEASGSVEGAAAGVDAESANVEGSDPSGSEEEYEVESIIAQRERRGQREYLVQWKGWSNDANTWEPESSLLGCEERMREFRETMAQREAEAARQSAASANAGRGKRRARGRH